MSKEIRILLLGESKVGKTTLILSLVSEKFSENVPNRAEEILIPADVNSERVPSQIVDFSMTEQSEKELKEQILLANVICLVYSVTSSTSIEKLSSYWLPFIKETCKSNNNTSIPIILVGNKLDLNEHGKIKRVLPIMNKFLEVETCVECSAKTMQNLSEAFWFSQKAVLYPTSPLYCPEKRQLSDKAVQCLTRIFRICDQDNDGYLSDRELEAFQRRCFKIALTYQALDEIKMLIRQNIPDGINYNGISLRGFLYLHLLFIHKGRQETIWAVLRKFGYDNNLLLTKEYLRPRIDIPRGCCAEISSQGRKFLEIIFNRFDEDKDGCLSPQELDNMFSICPWLAWDSDVCNTVQTNNLGWITKQGFYAYWSLLANHDPRYLLECLAHLGYTYEYAEGLKSALKVMRERRIDWHKKSTDRTVFYCQVYGARKVGKTCFLQALLGRNLQYHSNCSNVSGHLLNQRSTSGSGDGKYAGGAGGGLFNSGVRRSELPCSTAAVVPGYGDTERVLILHEIETGPGEQQTQEEACAADVVCLLYDSTDPDSFKYVADIFLQFYRGTKIPCLFVANKSDQVEVAQNYLLDPDEFASKYQMETPEKFSSMSDYINFTFFSKLVVMANYPHLRGMQIAQGDYTWKFTLAATVLAGFGFVAFRIAKTL